MHRCDLLVVGAGPAGSSAALEAARAGLKVLLAERKEVVGVPVRCAEYIPGPLPGELGLGRAYVVQGVSGMKTILPTGEVHLLRAPGFTIRRDIFDQTLLRAAREAGADVHLSTRVLGREGEEIVLREKGSVPFRVEARVVIGADGPRSTVGRWMGSVNRHMIPAAQVRVPLLAPLEHTEVTFHPEIYGGYGWLFPKGMEANVGLGRSEGGSGPEPLGELLNRFLTRLAKEGKVRPEPSGWTAGWIPSQPLKGLVRGNFLLAGDAAGQTHPITGAGVFQAVTAGRMAGRWAAEAVKRNEPDRLRGYEEEWRDLFGETMQRAFRRRLLLERGWDRLEEIVKSCWVSFREYYADPA